MANVRSFAKAEQRPAEQDRADTVAWPESAAELDQRVRSFVRDRPLTAVLAAAATGYVFARIAGRR